MKKNNKGFTLLELIVIVAIIAVISGLAAVSLFPILSTAAKQAATSAKAMIYQCKTDCMAKDPDKTCLVLENTEGRILATYYEGDLTTEVSSEKLSKHKVTLTYGGTTLQEGEKLFLNFDKSTGSLHHFGVADALENAAVAVADTNCLITLTSGSTTYELQLDPLTGVCKLKKQ